MSRTKVQQWCIKQQTWGNYVLSHDPNNVSTVQDYADRNLRLSELINSWQWWSNYRKIRKVVILLTVLPPTAILAKFWGLSR